MTDIGHASPEARQPLREPWGIWATLGWTVLAFAASSVASFAVLVVLRPESLLGSADLLMDGTLLSLTTLAAVPVQIGILVWAVRLAHWPVGEYLGFVWPNGRDAAVTIALLVVFLLAFDGMTYLLGRDVVTPFQIDTYRSARDAGQLPLMWFTIVIAAPIAEEVIFRGFLFRGWVAPMRRALPGILAISAVFAIIHVQYDWFGILQVFLIGLILAWARWRSGSTLLTMVMHMLTNLWATLETMVMIQWLS
jgi:membrane protease YdiL (CAAX protease family)